MEPSSRWEEKKAKGEPEHPTATRAMHGPRPCTQAIEREAWRPGESPSGNVPHSSRRQRAKERAERFERNRPAQLRAEAELAHSIWTPLLLAAAANYQLRCTGTGQQTGDQGGTGPHSPTFRHGAEPLPSLLCSLSLALSSVQPRHTSKVALSRLAAVARALAPRSTFVASRTMSTYADVKLPDGNSAPGVAFGVGTAHFGSDNDTIVVRCEPLASSDPKTLPRLTLVDLPRRSGLRQDGYRSRLPPSRCCRGLRERDVRLCFSSSARLPRPASAHC